ncbi:MAG: hypothetical protein KGI89_02965 [Euryarchaeota archaeon]|nr:hypothetical protein [Euryarchaeota archaeon]
MKNAPKGSKRYDATLPPFDSSIANVATRQATEEQGIRDQCPSDCIMRRLHPNGPVPAHAHITQRS